MRLHALAYFLGTLLAFLSIGNLSAQTCRINTGVKDNGCVLYTEVYEYDYVDIKPQFPGGGQSLINFVNANRHYPEEAYNSGIEGRVTCSFVVNSDGKVSHVKVLRGVEASLNKEAVRIISRMPLWEPGKIEGQAVPVRVVCCIPFRK